MYFLIKAVLTLLPFLLLLVVMWAVSYFRLELVPMVLLSTLGTIGFMALAIFAEAASEKLLRQTPAPSTENTEQED